MRSAVTSKFGRIILLSFALVIPAAAQSKIQNLYSGLKWQSIGPFEGGTVSAVAGIPGVPGIYTIVTPRGGYWKTADGGQSWISIELGELLPISSNPARWIDPANPKRIVRTEARGISVSLDGGQTWLAWHNLPIGQTESPADALPANAPKNIAGSPVRVVRKDNVRKGLLFAGTDESVYFSMSNGVQWEPLRLNMPVVSIRDLSIQGNDLIAATYGRSDWKLENISPLRQITATTASTPAVLFKPVEARRQGFESVVFLDYYLGTAAANKITLQIFDATGRLVHSATSDASLSSDIWIYVAQPLLKTAGEHRLMWNLHMDPPPAPSHKYMRMASALADGTPPSPDGPLVLPGTYKVALNVGGKTYTQPLIVRGESSSVVAQRQFGLAFKAYEAMKKSHTAWLQVSDIRTQLRRLLAAGNDPDLVQTATDLDSRLNTIDGSDWNGLVLPDTDNGADNDEEEEIRDEVPPLPPAPVSLTKDYDDPTTIVGRAFDNIAHPPAFAIVNTRLGTLLTRINFSSGAPTESDEADYLSSCQQMTKAFSTWKAMRSFDIPLLNRELTKRKLPVLTLSGQVPAAPMCK